jgi:hypothetical protein
MEVFLPRTLMLKALSHTGATNTTITAISPSDQSIEGPIVIIMVMSIQLTLAGVTYSM